MPFGRDPAFADRYRRGERNALEQVYRAHVDEVGMVLRRGFLLTGQGGRRVPGVDVDDLRDVVQEVFTRAFADKARASFDPRRPYAPYVVQIAKNLLIDLARKSGRRELLRAEPHDDDVIADIDEPDVDAQRRLDITKALVAQLTEPLKTLYALRYVEGRSQVDVAAAMQLTRKKVRLLEQELRDQLRAKLKERGLSDEEAA